MMKAYEILCEIRENIVPLLVITEKHNLSVDISAMQLDEAIFELEALTEVTFCHECGYSEKCVMEREWDKLSFECGECDDWDHFGLPFACNKGKKKITKETK